MVIRCERCSTLYELDETLLSPAGSQVQCTRCQHVFTAFPPRAPGRTLVGVPPPTPSEAPAAAEPSRAPPSAGRVNGAAAPARRATPSPAVAPAPASAPAPAEPPAPRPVVRSGPPPVYRPSAASSVAASASGSRAPLLKRDTIGTFESRLRWSARMKWLAPAIAAVVIGAGIAGWLLLSRGAEPEAARARAEAMALVALDDAASLEQAITRLDALLRRVPSHRGATSDRALAYVLRAAALVEEGESLSARAAARAAERERLRREQPPGWEEAERAALAEARRLDADAKAEQERARTLGGAAFQALRRLQAEQGDARDLSRALAAYFVLGGDRERATAALRSGRERTPADPWLDLAEGWLDVREAATRERALVQLGALSAAHPELLRARYLLATAQAALGHRAEAVTILDAVLAANGRHEGAKRLRDELSVRATPAPAPEAPPAAVAPPPPPLPVKPAPQPRKLVTHTAPPASPAVPAPEAKPAVADPLEAPEPVPSERAADEPQAPATPVPVPPATPSPAQAAPQAPATPPFAPPALDPRRDRDPTSPLGDGG